MYNYNIKNVCVYLILYRSKKLKKIFFTDKNYLDIRNFNNTIHYPSAVLSDSLADKLRKKRETMLSVNV